MNPDPGALLNSDPRGGSRAAPGRRLPARAASCLPDIVIPLLLGLAAFALYLSTLAPAVLYGDSGEFQYVPYLLGVAHPTGYPLYTLLGWAWSHLLPWGSVAYRMNLFSAFWAALAVAFLYPLVRVLLRRAFADLPGVAGRLIAALAALAFAVTPTFWSQAVIAEVYSLHILLVVLLLYLLVTWAECRSTCLLLLAAGCLGLGLAHHRTTLLLLPAVVAMIWLTDPRALLSRRVWPRALLLALVPLALYLYLPWRAPHSPYMVLPLGADRQLVRYEPGLSGFLDLVLAGPFAGWLDFSADLGAGLTYAWRLLLAAIGWPGLALALIGVGWLAFGRRGRSLALLVLLGLVGLGTAAFNLFYTIYDIAVLYIPACLVLVLCAAVGVGVVVHLVRARLAGALAVLALFVWTAWAAALRYPDVDRSQEARAVVQMEAILAAQPAADAVLVGPDPNEMIPFWYYQYVEGRRTDLLNLFVRTTPDYPTLSHVLDLALTTGRPVYLIRAIPGMEAKVRAVPEGGLWRVLGPAVEEGAPYPVDALLGDRMRLAGYDRSPRSPHPGDLLQVSLFWEALGPPAGDLHSFVHLVDGAGNGLVGSDHLSPASSYAAISWRAGEPLRDDHTLAVPADARPGVYRLLAGLYTLAPGGALCPVGEPLALGLVGVKAASAAELPATRHPVAVEFAGQIELLGYDVRAVEEGLALTFLWRCLEPPVADYAVFVHLVDPAGQITAQRDGPPQSGAYPTSIWDPGEVVRDEKTLALPPGLEALLCSPEGQSGYRLRVGLYLPGSGVRLGVAGGGDHVELDVRGEEWCP